MKSLLGAKAWQMTEDQRLNIQYEILLLLKSIYHGISVYNDEDDIHDEARKDSYKIMKIIEDGLKEQAQ